MPNTKQQALKHQLVLISPFSLSDLDSPMPFSAKTLNKYAYLSIVLPSGEQGRAYAEPPPTHSVP